MIDFDDAIYELKKFFNSLLDFIYMQNCYFCGSSTESKKFCSKCFEQLKYSDVAVNRQVLSADIYCAGEYDSMLQKLIRGIKYHDQYELAYYMALYMYNYWKMLGLGKDFVIVPVPLHPKREKTRHYNQMALVAEELSTLSSMSVTLDFIKRIKNTKPQYHLKSEERRQNMANAFSINPILDKSKQILLIDDICTTGSTFESIVSELHKNGYENVTCFACTGVF